MSLLDSSFYSDVIGAEYELMLSAFGEGVLSESQLLDMQKPTEILKSFKSRYHRFPKSISLLIQDSRSAGYKYGFTGIETSLLESFDTLKELILPDTITNIEITKTLEEILQKNKTLIRGSFDSYAEKLAKEQNLHFRPSNYIFADFEDTRFHENTTLTLVFKRNGNVEIKENCSSPGTSSSNTLGGSFTYALSNDFYQTQTASQIASTFDSCACKAIIDDGRLSLFIEKAKEHDYYKGKI